MRAREFANFLVHCLRTEGFWVAWQQESKSLNEISTVPSHCFFSSAKLFEAILKFAWLHSTNETCLNSLSRKFQLGTGSTEGTQNHTKPKVIKEKTPENALPEFLRQASRSARPLHSAPPAFAARAPRATTARGRRPRVAALPGARPPENHPRRENHPTLVGTSASLLVTSALLVVTRSY